MKSVFFAAAPLIGALAASCSWQIRHVQADSDSGYVDASLCASCHASIARTYSLTGMARSIYRFDPASAPEDFEARHTVAHEPSGRYYEMIKNGDSFLERRYELGYLGKVENADEKQIDFVIGSGNHARTYLHRTAEGKLLELPVSWYAERGGYWAMSPGYDRPDPEDFQRAISFGCLFCHAAYPPERQIPQATGDETIFGKNIPEGIDCQRCHGPGRDHIEAARSPNATPQTIRAAITNPARLNRERRMEVCLQCHLETTSATLPAEIRRFDREPFSYRPGQPLGDFALYFDRAPAARDGERVEVANAAYRLVKSECFRKSQMTCVTCHNPHDVPRGQPAVEYYVTVCRSCHNSPHSPNPEREPALSAASNCLECHMPKRRTDDAVHVVMTDHYIQRRKPARDLLAPLDETAQTPKNYRGEVVPYYPVPFPTDRNGELYSALAQVLEESNLRGGIVRLQQAVMKYKPVNPQFSLELGRAFSRVGKADDAIHWYEESLRVSSTFRPALRELLAALVKAGLTRRAIETGEGASRENPDPAVLTALGAAYLQQGDVDRALSRLHQALAIDPDLPATANLLGLAYARTGNRVAAEAAFRDALRVAPGLADAQDNLGNLLAEGNNFAEAGFHFERAIRSKPDFAEAHRSFAIALMSLRSWDKAVEEMEQAARLTPNKSESHSELADLLAATNRTGRAVEEYRAAIRLGPDLAEPYYRLGLVLRKQGKTGEAVEQFRLAIQKASKSGSTDTGAAAEKELQSTLSASRP